MDIPINYYAVIAAAVVNMVLGFVWYGPLFGKMWLPLAGWTQETMAAVKGKNMTMTYVLQVVMALIMSYTLAHAIVFGTTYTGTFGILGGITAAFWYWLGFVAPVTMAQVMWENKTWTYWMITAGYYLVAMLIMGAILGGWQ